MVAFLVGRNNFYQTSSRGCKRSNRVIFVLILKTIYSKNSLRDSWVKMKKRWVPWAEPCMKPQTREVRSVTNNIPVWAGLDKQENLSLSFLLFVLTHFYTHIQIAMHILSMLQNILKLHGTEHHTALNKPTRQDDLGFSRRQHLHFSERTGWSSEVIILNKHLASFTLHSELTASSPLSEMI